MQWKNALARAQCMRALWVLFDSYNILVKTTITKLSQKIYITHPYNKVHIINKGSCFVFFGIDFFKLAYLSDWASKFLFYFLQNIHLSRTSVNVKPWTKYLNTCLYTLSEYFYFEKKVGLLLLHYIPKHNIILFTPLHFLMKCSSILNWKNRYPLWDLIAVSQSWTSGFFSINLWNWFANQTERLFHKLDCNATVL